MLLGEVMVRVKIATKKDACKQGIHVFNANQKVLEIAKERASSLGFKTIYVHKRLKTFQC